jgi:nucleoid-associated protein YgaU
MERAVIVAFASVLAYATATPLGAQNLRGSPQAMQKQNRVAIQHDYTFLRTSVQVRRFVDAGYLVKVPGNADYELASVSHPYARPAVKLFIERLSAQYRAACGEKLVVTSLTRPLSEQPRNASALSVHPAGMAVDLRVSGRAACRNWLERTLMSLERRGVLDAIREQRPPHYHVALFPEPYTRYVASLGGSVPGARVASASSRAAERPLTVTANASPRTDATAIADALAAAPEAVREYRVSRGDSLWSIARRHGTTVETLQALNGLPNSRIIAGQVLSVPSGVATGADS